MSKLRRLMNRLSHGALTSVAALALTVTATNLLHFAAFSCKV